MSSIKLRRLASSDSLSVLAIIVVIVLCILAFKPNYLSGDNVFSLLRVLAVTAVVGLSQMVVMATGGMNVAIGAVGGLCAVLLGVFIDWLKLDPLLSVALVIAAGAVCGLVNGFITLRCGGVGVASFLATLATASVFGGIKLSITRGKPIYGLPDGFLALGNLSIAGIPFLAFVMFGVAGLCFLFFKYSKMGRQLLAFGGNGKAAELYGVSKTRVIMAAHVIGCVLAALGGMMTVARIQAAQTNIGADWMLASMAAPLLGGVRAAGGKINILGTILGAVVLAIIANALIHFKVDIYWNDLINGLVILAVAGINRARSARAV
jgi:ribose transport system permease protein